jgi:F0F1-type ATP synthase membrane subunit b/b'
MDLLRGLGVVPEFLGYHLVIFLMTYLFLHFVLFRPYFKAYLGRVERTMGRAEMAERYLAESRSLQAEYEAKAQELSHKYRAIFDSSRAKAMREYDQMVNEARQAAKAEFETAKKSIAAEMQGARKNLQAEVPVLSEVITARLLGKDLAQ